MFILRKDRPTNSLEEWDSGWQRYQQYLTAISSRLSASALAYAVADWHYNHLDPRAPHDAWLQKLDVFESKGASQSGAGNARIIATLLGAYHDGIVEFEYADVLAYSVQRNAHTFGDWQYDEVRLSEDGNVLHEVEFDRGSLVVECRDVAYRWLPHN